MIRALLLSLAFLILQSAPAPAPMSNGTPPPPKFGARDLFSAFHLPAPPERPSDVPWKASSGTQLMGRARRLGITDRSATETWFESQGTYLRAQHAAQQPLPEAPILFRGSKASALNALLAKPQTRAVRVLSLELTLDQPLRITGNHQSLDLGAARLRMPASLVGPGRYTSPYMVRIEAVQDVHIVGGVLLAGPWGVLVRGSRFVVIEGMTIEGLTGGGILLTGSRDCLLWGNTLRDLGSAPVFLHGHTTDTAVAQNDIEANRGASNWRAGIVLSDRNADLAADPDSLLNPDHFGVREDPMTNRQNVPHDNVIALNRITGNHSSGIYSDGGARNVFAANRVEANSREGICLDNGSLANVVAYNLFQANGKRWGESDADLKLDFIAQLGRLPDATSPAKVPAISLDNAAYNQVVFNEINGNFGGGIKIVRTGFFNLLGMNTLTDNNEGQSATFHFFGIELGAARADVPVKDLDFGPSRGNLIFNNLVRGAHYAGIFFAEGSDENQIFDNSIFGATSWAMESVRRQNNHTLNNLTNEPSRNIDPGLDPTLRKISAGVFDRQAGVP